MTEPPAPWLAVALLDEAANLTPDQVSMLADAERSFAWALARIKQQLNRSSLCFRALPYWRTVTTTDLRAITRRREQIS
jgi:DNA polymerase III psi subunit